MVGWSGEKNLRYENIRKWIRAISTNQRFKTSKGVITDKDLLKATEEEIREVLEVVGCNRSKKKYALNTNGAPTNRLAGAYVQ